MPFASTDNFGTRMMGAPIYRGQDIEPVEVAFLHEGLRAPELHSLSGGRILRNTQVYDDGLGLDQIDLYRMYNLPKHLIALIHEEMKDGDPEFVRYIKGVLKHPDAKQRIIQDITEEVYEELYAKPEPAPGMGDLGFLKKVTRSFKKRWKKTTGFVKKTFDRHKKIFKKAGRGIKKVAKKVGKGVKKVGKKIVKGVKKVWVKYGPLIVSVAGAVLAPFTGGASLAVAGLIVAADNVYRKKKAAKVAKKMAKQEAAEVAAEARAADAELKKELDAFYDKNTAWFLQHEITRDKWDQLTNDQKIEILKAASEGRMPSEQAAAARAAEADEAAAKVPEPQPPYPGCVPKARTRAEDLASFKADGWRTLTEGGREWLCPPARDQKAPATATVERDLPGTYDIHVEGRKVGSYSSPEAAAAAVSNLTKRGDRFEVAHNGRSTGLQVRTTTGSYAVPPGQVQTVSRASNAEMEEIVEKAEADKGIPGWVLVPAAAGAAIVAALATGAV